MSTRFKASLRGTIFVLGIVLFSTGRHPVLLNGSPYFYYLIGAILVAASVMWWLNDLLKK